SVIMIFEVTRDYTIIVPLMISNMIAFYISQRLQHEPIYEALALQDGVHLPTGSHRATARRLTASAAVREAPAALQADLSVTDAIARVAEGPNEFWPVADGHAFVGMIGEQELTQARNNGRGDAR